jgi:hypothetical protein
VTLDGRCVVPVVRTVIGRRQIFTTPIRAGKLKNWKSDMQTGEIGPPDFQVFTHI